MTDRTTSTVSDPLQSSSQIERWSLINAVMILPATGGAVWFATPWPPLLVGTGLLTALAMVARGAWTARGRFGVPNGITAVRVALLFLLPAAGAAGGEFILTLSVVILASDGVDGWLARRWDLTSEFGTFFDKETDALFLLLLCIVSASEGHLPSWIVGAGVLRYGFVLALFVSSVPQKTEQKASWARYVYGAMVGGLLSSFVLPASASYPIAFLATTALAASFARSLWTELRRRPVAGGP